ncbi:hypothetical protein [Clostridium perfringens]|nr:hypothetical protein [Clostridium perfringens]MDB2049603.1 hypothetical protein [Clostridium perfringens]
MIQMLKGEIELATRCRDDIYEHIAFIRQKLIDGIRKFEGDEDGNKETL